MNILQIFWSYTLDKFSILGENFNKIYQSINSYPKNFIEGPYKFNMYKPSNAYNYKLSFPYHLVSNSPWPLFLSIYLFFSIFAFVLLLYQSLFGSLLMFLSLLGLLFVTYLWFKDIIIESTYTGYHTKTVQKGIMIGLILFVISEICLFSSLFFSYFYNSLIPSIEVSCYLPPIGILAINPKSLPLLNTIILFVSGITSTISLNLFISNSTLENKTNKNKVLFSLGFTIILGIIFSYFQFLEYYTSSFTISDSVYGSNLYLLTGFHGIHVIIGIILLIVTYIRIYMNHITREHYLLFSFANLYWHFVDYVWLILYIFLYCWNS